MFVSCSLGHKGNGAIYFDPGLFDFMRGCQRNYITLPADLDNQSGVLWLHPFRNHVDGCIISGACNVPLDDLQVGRNCKDPCRGLLNGILTFARPRLDGTTRVVIDNENPRGVKPSCSAAPLLLFFGVV